MNNKVLLNLNEINNFYIYTIKKIPEETPSTRSRVYFKNILNNTALDLKMATLLKEEKIDISFSNSYPWKEYCKHIIRSFIIETFSITEKRLSENCEEKNIDAKGKNHILYNLISKANKKTRSKEIKKWLNEALEKININFSDSSNQLSKLLDKHKESRKKWLSFFNSFRILRNCVHNNFICQIDFKFNKRNFKKNKPVSIDLNNDLPFIMNNLVELFDIIDTK